MKTFQDFWKCAPFPKAEKYTHVGQISTKRRRVKFHHMF